MRVQAVISILNWAKSEPEQAASKLTALLGLKNAATLPAEMMASPIGEATRTQEDEEAIETAGAVGAVEMMTMIGSKGLSAHHVVMIDVTT